jgi:hypothetical protein
MDHLRDPYASAFDVPIIGSIVSGTVQFFFVYRVWVLSGRKSWPYCMLIAVVSRSYKAKTTIRARAHYICSVLLSTLSGHLLGGSM